MSITLAHITGREDPKWEWFCDALCRQASPAELAELDIIFIDRLAWGAAAAFASGHIPLQASSFKPSRLEKLAAIVRGRFAYRHLAPLPNVYQGPFRLTRQDMFYAAVNRNTAIVAARGDYLMVCDDLALPMPGWFSAVKRGAAAGWLLAGMYKKLLEMVVLDGQLQSFRDHPPGVDSRWGHGSEEAPTPWSGSAVYGCSFGAPLAKLLQVDGNGLETAGAGAEDYCLGIRLERAGCKVMLDRTCLTYESEEAHGAEPSLPRSRKVVSPDRLPPGYEGDPHSDHVHVNALIKDRARILPMFPNNLAAIRAFYLQTGLVPIPTEPHLDWRDGSPLSSL